MTTNGALITLHSFDYTDGANPEAGLVQGADGNLYGTTFSGGTDSSGTVFKMTTNGALTTLYSFDYTDGANPEAGLVQGADGNFYGTTEYGGTYFTGVESLSADGTVFKITTNGTLTTLLSLAGTNGDSPQGALVQGADGCFYGTTAYGGVGFNGAKSSGDGIVFRVGAAPAKAPPAIIAQPVGQIVPVGGAAIFSVNAGGAAPLGYSWQLNGGPIAGATQSSYTNNNVQLTDSGSQFSCVISNAYGSVTSSNAALTVFNASGPLFTFNGADGGYSSAALIQGADGNFYGTTTYGGTYGQGTVFRLTTNGLLSTLVSFNLTNGANPEAGLTQGADGNFYGTTSYGGTNSIGTVFRMTTNGALSVLASFNYGVTGGYPYAGLVQGADGNFYGTTTYGGTYYSGAVFRMTTNGALSALASFNYSVTGGYPYGGLVQGADGNFYGTTSYGGTNGYGTVFSVATNGALTILLSFDYANGAYSEAGLVQGADGNFYGTTANGGTDDDGTVFSVTTNGTLTTLLSFDYANGANPEAGLVQGADGNFYGTTAFGGTDGNGTVFRMTTNGTVTNLVFFDNTNGATPSAALIQGSDGNFYTTTSYGGAGYDGLYPSGNGTVFRLAGAFKKVAPLIVTQPASQTVSVGGMAAFSVTAASPTPLSYFWHRNGAPLAGATASTCTTNNVQLSDSGSQFSCLVSNGYGTALSSNATLTVLPLSLVQNGGFELGSFADWTTSGNFQYCYVVSIAPYVHSGTYGAELGPVGSLGYISQTLATTVGQFYQISCWLYSDGLTPNEFSVSWNGATLFDQTNVPDTLWTNIQFQAGATATNTVLALGFRIDPSNFGLDDIAVYPITFIPPQFQTVALTNGTISFSWGAEAAQLYQVQSTTNLAQNTWTNWGGVLSTTNSSITVTDSATNSPERFYRVVLLP